MLRKYLGTTGVEVSELALGTMTWGRDTDEYEAREQLDLFFEAGGNLIDTADTFSGGSAESMLGEFLAEIPRDEYIVSTKAGRVEESRLYNSSRSHLLATLDASLDRLHLDYIDIWQVNGFDSHTDPAVVADVLNTAISSGKVRYVGVSNYSPWQLVHLHSLLPAGKTLGCGQFEYSLLQRGIERDVLPAAQHLGMGILAWSPLGRGVLTGKYRNNIPADSRAASPHWGGFARSLLTDNNRKIVEAVSAAAQGLGVTPIDIALTWVRERTTSAITGARTAAQLRALLATTDCVLPEEITAALNDISDPGFSYPDAALH